MIFDVELPNAREGTSTPVGSITPRDIAAIAVEAETLGFDALWTNDFITPTPCYQVPDGPRPAWHEPMITLAYCAALTRKIKLGTAVLMAPFRDPIILAKEAATLDQFSEGRLLLGLGIGMCRDELGTIRPRDSRIHRGRHLTEFIEALQRLLSKEAGPVSYAGKYIAFLPLELDPKPYGRQIPLYVPGRADEQLERVARYGLGIMMRAATVAGQVEKLKPYLDAAGRDLATVDVVAEVELRIAPTHEQAVADYVSTAHGRWRTEVRGMKIDQILADNWIGTAEEILQKIDRLARQGIKHFSVLNIAADTTQDHLDQMGAFSEQVMRTCKATVEPERI